MFSDLWDIVRLCYTMDTKTSTVAKRARNPRHYAYRREDRDWSWPRTLCFLKTEEFQVLPEDIKGLVLQYISKELLGQDSFE